MEQQLTIYHKSLQIFAIALWWVIEYSEDLCWTKELQTVCVGSHINLLNDNGRATEPTQLEKQKDFYKVRIFTFHIVYKIYKVINESMHRKKMSYLSDKYRKINCINRTSKQKCSKMPEILGIFRYLLSVYLPCINSHQSTGKTKMFQKVIKVQNIHALRIFSIFS